MSQTDEQAVACVGDEIKPYKMRVSSKYLDLTKHKLELARLLHQGPEPRSEAWWELQSTVEPLLDFWLEQFSWRLHEDELNAQVPQFLTAVRPAGMETPVRLHFIHSRSPYVHVIPLLLIPAFPFTNLSMAHLVSLFTEPGNATAEQPFHLVVPSLPGLGFSDPLPDQTPVVQSMAYVLVVLMRRLGYQHFLVTNSGPAAGALSEVDWMVANHLALHHRDSCLGAHFVSPSLGPPRVWESPVSWIKWKAATLLRIPILGYSREDLKALERADASGNQGRNCLPAALGFGMDGVYESNTLSYALCDSPLGLLLFFLMVLRISGLKKILPSAEIIKMTELTWLPGPEGTMRLWAHCASSERRQERKPAGRPRIAITVFLGHEEKSRSKQKTADAQPRTVSAPYTCPAWAGRQYQVLVSRRVEGRPGLLAWKRPEEIASGVRRLAKALSSVDERLRTSEAPSAPPLEQVVVDGVLGTTADSKKPTQTYQSTAGHILRGESLCVVQLAREEMGSRSTQGAWERPKRSSPLPERGLAEARQSSGAVYDNDSGEMTEGSPDTVIALQIRS